MSLQQHLRRLALAAAASALFWPAAALAQTLTIGVRAGPGIDRSALHRDRHPCRGAEARLRHAGLVRRQAPARAGACDLLEGRRPDDLGVQAARGREIPRRLGLHGRGREVLDRAHPDRVGPEPDDDLRPPRQGGEGRRPAHGPRRHRRAGADAAERLHPPVHRLGEGGRRPDQGERQRRLQFRQGGDRHRPVPVRLLDAEGGARARALRRLLARRLAVAEGGAQGDPERFRPRRAAQGRPGRHDRARAGGRRADAREGREAQDRQGRHASTSSTSSSTSATSLRRSSPRTARPCRRTRSRTRGCARPSISPSTARRSPRWRWRASAGRSTRW